MPEPVLKLKLRLGMRIRRRSEFFLSLFHHWWNNDKKNSERKFAGRPFDVFDFFGLL